MVAEQNSRVTSVCVLRSFVGFLSFSNWIGDVFILEQTNMLEQNIPSYLFINIFNKIYITLKDENKLCLSYSEQIF